MEQYELIKEIRQLHLREWEIKKQFDVFLNDKFAKESTYSVGEIVEVWKEGKYIEDGIIERGSIHCYMESHDIKKYVDHPIKFLDAIRDFRYVVKKFKKDGTISLRNVSSSRTVGIEDDGYGHYIQKKST